jgi:hypothetical protein
MKRLSLLDIFHVRHTQAQGRPSEEIISTCPNFEVFLFGLLLQVFWGRFSVWAREKKHIKHKAANAELIAKASPPAVHQQLLFLVFFPHSILCRSPQSVSVLCPGNTPLCSPSIDITLIQTCVSRKVTNRTNVRA